MDFDAELLDILKPLYILSCIFCLRKYSIRNAMVLTTGLKEIALTMSANSLLVYLFYATFQSTEFNSLSLKLYYIVIYGQHLFSFIVISCFNIRLRKVNVALMKLLQEIYCFERVPLLSKFLKRNLRVGCFVLVYIYIGVIVPKLVLDPYWNWARAVFLGLTIVIDFEVVFVIFVIRLLALKFKVWSEVAKKLSTETKKYSNDANDINTEHGIYLEDIEDSPEQIQDRDIEECRDEDRIVSDSDNVKKLFVVFNQLVDATNVMKSAFQLTIFYHAFTLFTQALVYIAVLIMWIKLAEYDFELERNVVISHSTGIVLWIVKALVLQALLGHSTEGLYSAVRASRSEACVLLAQHDSATTRYAKNALRLSTSRLQRFTAVGALPVDAALPLRLAALVGSYTVILLQFALL